MFWKAYVYYGSNRTYLIPQNDSMSIYTLKGQWDKKFKKFFLLNIEKRLGIKLKLVLKIKIGIL